MAAAGWELQARGGDEESGADEERVECVEEAITRRRRETALAAVSLPLQAPV